MIGRSIRCIIRAILVFEVFLECCFGDAGHSCADNLTSFGACAGVAAISGVEDITGLVDLAIVGAGFVAVVVLVVAVDELSVRLVVVVVVVISKIKVMAEVEEVLMPLP